MKVCIVALHLYPFISQKKTEDKIGGAELQQAMLAKAFVKNDLEVTVITLDCGQAKYTEYDGVKVIHTFKENQGVSGLRFFYPRLYEIIKALYIADADIYYVRCAGYLTGVVALFGRLFRKKVVFAAGHDTDFIPGNYLISLRRDKWLHKIGLKLVSQIIVQSTQQLKLLKNNFYKDGMVIRNFSMLPVNEVSYKERKTILWVSTMRDWKRPMLFLELAKLHPGKSFVMIGGPDAKNNALYEDVKQAAGKLANLDFKGFQPIEKTEKYFDQCAVFVNTSKCEGFPNTFIQAWRRGIPCLSFFDPDGVIEKFGLGEVADEKEDFFVKLNNAEVMSKENSKRIIEYYQQNHSEVVLSSYLSLFKTMLS